MRAFNFLISLPETTLKSLISSLSGVIPESDRVSPSYSGSAFRSFVVDVLYSIVLLMKKKKNAFVPLDHVTQKGSVYLSFGELLFNFSKAGVYLFVEKFSAKQTFKSNTTVISGL